MVDFIALKSTIEKMFGKGFSTSAIFWRLKKENKISMSHSQFARYVADHGLKKKKSSNKSDQGAKGPPPAKPMPPRSPDKGSGPSQWRTEEKPKPRMNISTIGKEYLMEPYTGDDNNDRNKKG